MKARRPMPTRTIIGGKKYQIFVVSVTASLLIINEIVHYCGPFNKSSYLDVLIVKDVRLQWSALWSPKHFHLTISPSSCSINSNMNSDVTTLGNFFFLCFIRFKACVPRSRNMYRSGRTLFTQLYVHLESPRTRFLIIQSASRAAPTTISVTWALYFRKVATCTP